MRKLKSRNLTRKQRLKLNNHQAQSWLSGLPEYVRDQLQGNARYYVQQARTNEEAIYKQTQRTQKKIAQVYQDTYHDIQSMIESWIERVSDVNGVSLVKAKRLLTKKERNTLRMDIQRFRQLARKGGRLTEAEQRRLENASAKFHITRLEEQQLRARFRILKHGVEVGTLTKQHLKDVFKTSLKTTTARLKRNVEVDNAVFEKRLEDPWGMDGRSFSQRLWKNQNHLSEAVSLELHKVVNGISTPEQSAKRLASNFNVRKNQAYTLIRTESNRLHNEANLESCKALDAPMYRIVATLDFKTSSICREMDGRIIPVKKAKIGLNLPPFHPNCRTTIAPVLEEDSAIPETRMMRDGGDQKNRIASNKEVEQFKRKYWGVENQNVSPRTIAFREKMRTGELDFSNAREREKITVSSEAVQKATGYSKDKYRVYSPTPPATMYEVRGLKYAQNVYVSEGAKDYVEAHMDQVKKTVYRLRKAQRMVEIPGYKMPELRFCSPRDFGKGNENTLASYNEAEHFIRFNIRILEDLTLLALQKGVADPFDPTMKYPGPEHSFVLPDNPLSTLVHELSHVKDALFYRKMFGLGIAPIPIDYFDGLVGWLIDYTEKEVKKMHMIDNVFVSEYYEDSYMKNSWFECLAELRVLKKLGGK